MSTLITERLKFRTWSESDVDLAMRLWGDPDVMAFISGQGGLTRAQVAARLETEHQTLSAHGMQYWPLFERTSGEYVGCCGLRPWLHTAREATEIGCHLIKDKWGKGYAREAAERVVAHARELGIPRLMAGHHPDNHNSKRILENLGFEFLEMMFYKPTGLLHPSYVLNL